MNSKILLFALLFFSWLVFIESSSSGMSHLGIFFVFSKQSPDWKEKELGEETYESIGEQRCIEIE